MVFPSTPLSKFSKEPYPCRAPARLDKEGLLVVDIYEEGLYELATLQYRFDSSLRTIAVSPNDHYKAYLETAMKPCSRTAINWEKHNRDLLLSVQYWTDSGWVSEGQLREIGEKSD
jgi:hypothetical protein